MRTLLANIHAKIVNISPRATVKIDEGIVMLGNLEGSLKNDKTIRNNTIDSIMETYGVKGVVFEKPVTGRNDHVNPFHNLE